MKNITRKEAECIADSILNSGFFVSGYGHFNITRNEFINIIMIAINRENTSDMQRYYKVLHDKVFGKDIVERIM